MKIGLLTLPLNLNYGGVLQAYALQNILSKMGHEVWLIDRVENSSLDLKFTIKRMGRKILYPAPNPSHLHQFIEQQITPKTKQIDSNKKMHQLKKMQMEAYIVGSDQVWREKYCRSIKMNYFLDFVEDVKALKIAYAASFGVDAWEYDEGQTLTIRNLLHCFKAVSVREKSAVHLCKEFLDIDAQHLQIGRAHV